MEDFDRRERKLLEYRDLIMRMPSNVSKVNLISGYVNYLTFYKYIRNLSFEELLKFDIDKDFLQKYRVNLHRCVQKRLIELSELSPFLHSKFDELISEYKRNNFYSFEPNCENHVSLDRLYGLTGAFVAFLGEDVRKVFYSIFDSNNFFVLKEYEADGFSIDAKPMDNYGIALERGEKQLDFYFAFVHELGHCYHNYLQRNHKHIDSLDSLCETTPLLFERMFYTFLETEPDLRKQLFNIRTSDHIYMLNDLAAAKIICELFMNNDVLHVDDDILSYESSVPIEELLQRMEKDCGYILSNKKYFALTSFHYAISDIIANYFFHKMQTDFHGTWKEYRDFVCMAENYPLREILEKYMDVDLYKEDINGFIKSYQSR